MKKLLLIVVVVIIVLFFVFRGGKDAKAPLSSVSPKAETSNTTDDVEVVKNGDVTSASPTTTITADESDNTSTSDSPPDENGVLRNAQTYTNKADGYSVNLHEWWWYDTRKGRQETSEISVVYFDRNKIDENQENPIAPIKIVYFTGNDDLLKNLDEPNSTIKNITVDGKPAVQKITTNGQSSGSKLYGVWVEKEKGKFFAITYVDTNSSGKYLEIYNAMVQSFKFLD